jgi:hypothetical protein
MVYSDNNEFAFYLDMLPIANISNWMFVSFDPIENLINDQFIVFYLGFILKLKKNIYINGMETEGIYELLELEYRNRK